MNRRIICIICSLILTAIFICLYLFFASKKLEINTLDTQTYQQLKQKNVYLNIFVHGSFGTMLGMLSLTKIAQDEVKNSLYRETIKKMRKNPKHFTEQPILKKGLIKVNPTFETMDVENKKLAAYPILKAYQTMLDQAQVENQLNYFYTFGWTGLMSQTRRRIEAIRFYNELSEELEQYHKNGIEPKIRILAHSHGGNISLNLAAVNKIVQTPNFTDITKWSDDKNENESLNEMCSIIKGLPNKETAKQRSKMKQFDYLPSRQNFDIYELILLGTPIQPETETFCTYQFFDKIYNFYSEKDFIQRIDFITTKQWFSEQRFAPQIITKCNKGPKKKLIQARIMIDRDWTNAQANKKDDAPSTSPDSTSILTHAINTAQAYFSEETSDPGHKDLWFIDWEKENEDSLLQMPTVIFIPLIVKAIKQTNTALADFDVNITTSPNNKYLKIQISKYNEFTKIKELNTPIEIIEGLKLNLKKWAPLKIEKTTTITAFLSNLRQSNKNFNN